MVNTVKDSVEANTEFTKGLMLRAAAIVGDARKERIPVIDALRQARDEFLKTESKQRKKARTYHFGDLVHDLRWYVIEHENGDAQSLAPLAEWEQQQDPGSLAEKLKGAGESIASTVEEQTKSEGWFRKLNDQELGEYILMQRAVTFLGKQGLTVEIDWEGRNRNSPIDYQGKVDGETWAFELKQLREDPEGYQRKMGHPNEKKPLEEQLASLQEPLPRTPGGPDSLRKNLTRLVENAKRKANEIPNGTKYCLVIHNRQFLYIPDWEEVTWPNLGSFNAVMILHEETMPFAQVWEVISPSDFGRPVQSQTLENLAKMAEESLSQAANPEVLRAAWDELKERNITDEDIQETLREVRSKG